MSKPNISGNFPPVEGVSEEDKLVLAALLVSSLYVFDHSITKS